ncbi:MAG TPA: hypothetical protein VNW92_13435 [Polyangiaceae bacterium]|jgi:hypothetical protein|nr:hypothetical protein [Polyangiaceae bacterium]
MTVLRFLMLVSSALAFLWYAGKDMRFHLVGRRVSGAENAMHGALGLSQLALLVGAFFDAGAWAAGGALATALLGASDEYVFHRGIPGAESDLHAKAHLALFIFVAVALALPVLVNHAH